MDVDTIGPGSDFYEAIDEAIASCDVVMALIGRQWLSATDAKGQRRLDDPEDVLRVELERALAHGLVIIPARVQDAELPSAEDLPDSLAPLARRQAIELRDTAWRDDVARLVRSLDRIAAVGAREAAGAAPASSRVPRPAARPGAQPETGGCSEDGSSGETTYEVDGEEVGRYFCFLDGEQPHLVWTDTRATGVADAWVSSGTGQKAVESLRRQWDCCLQLTP